MDWYGKKALHPRGDSAGRSCHLVTHGAGLAAPGQKHGSAHRVDPIYPATLCYLHLARIQAEKDVLVLLVPVDSGDESGFHAGELLHQTQQRTRHQLKRGGTEGGICFSAHVVHGYGRGQPICPSCAAGMAEHPILDRYQWTAAVRRLRQFAPLIALLNREASPCQPKSG